MMAKVLVLTDLHIVEEEAEIIGLDPFLRAQEVLNHAVSHHADADHLVICGDLTHHGRPQQYERLKALLDGVEIPLSLLMGNHDRREAFHEVFGGTGFVQAVVSVGQDRLICLDTLDGPPYPDGHHAGLLCEERLAWLDQQIGETPGRAIVFMHHPPFDVGFDGMDQIKLANSDAFFDLTERHGKVAQLICGHVHRTISGNARGIPFSIFKSPCHQMPMVLGEGVSSLSVDEPGAYGIILIEEDRIIVHSEDVFSSPHKITVDGHSA